jgi:hypothetical protein
MSTGTSAPFDPLMKVFRDNLTQVRERELRRTLLMKGTPPEIIGNSVDEADHAAREERRQEAVTEFRDVTAAIMRSSDQYGRIRVLENIDKQGTFVNVRHRAAVLRHSSYLRRVVHASTRRNGHAVDGGYFNRRIESEILDHLQKALQ